MTELDPNNGGPASFPIAVVINRKPSTNRWLKHSWRVSGIIVDRRQQTAINRGVKIRSADDGEDFIWTGLPLKLYKDEAESYYHNLMAPNPSIFVVTRTNEQDQPEPFIVSASFDEAHAYLEADDQAHALAMPAELYHWIERFVLTHYVPEPRKKRKRQDWKQSGNPS